MNVYNGYRLINSGNVTVPTNYLCLHWYGTPTYSSGVSTPYQSGISQSAVFNYDWCTVGNGNTCWQKIETSSGSYTYTALDAWASFWANKGVELRFCNVNMPSFYSANAGTSISPNPYSVGAGSGGPLSTSGSPSGLVGHGNFVTAVINHLKGKGTPLKYWALWEEPGPFPGTLGTGTWWGTAGQLVDLCYTGYTAAKAADPTITVLSPLLVPTSFGFDSWINATGTTNTTVSGYQTFDAYAADPFGYSPTNWSYGFPPYQSSYSSQLSYTQNPALPTDLDVVINSMITQMGANVKPLHLTSVGWSYIGNGSVATYFMAQPALYRKQYTARMLLQAAARGVKSFTIYGADAYTASAQNFGGDFVNDTNGVVAGFNEIAANVVGKTITFCGVRGDGQMWASFTDGSNYTI